MDYKKKLEELILTVIHEGGSDLHLGTGRVPAIRVAGELIFLTKSPIFTETDTAGGIGEVFDKNKTATFFF